MAADLRKLVSIGLQYTVINRRLDRVWRGSITRIQRELNAEGIDPQSIFTDSDTQVSIKPQGLSLASMASMEGLTETFEAFEKAINTTDNDQLPLLFQTSFGFKDFRRGLFIRLCAARGVIDILEAIRQRAPDELIACDRLGMTALSWACCYGQLDVIRWAIARALRMDQVNSFCWNYADLAFHNAQPEILADINAVGILRNAPMMEALQTLGVKQKEG